jgi:hypothetical protein
MSKTGIQAGVLKILRVATNARKEGICQRPSKS